MMRPTLLMTLAPLMLAACTGQPADTTQAALTAEQIAGMSKQQQERECAVLTPLPDTASHSTTGRNVVQLESPVIVSRATIRTAARVATVAEGPQLPTYREAEGAWVLSAPCIVVRSPTEGMRQAGAASTTTP